MTKLNVKSLREIKNTVIISTEESLEDIIPIDWFGEDEELEEK